jgi:2-polyprenyl-6-methoxyphenol hydroxylase-like FAD-dependent oxidoreductase
MVVRTDVLICGAGPVGLSLAAQLQRMGVSCQLVDKNRSRSDKSKALVVWGRSLELLDTCMDANSFLEHGRPVRKAKFYEEGVQFAEIEFATNDSEFGTGVLIPQSLTEKILEDHLSDCGGEVQRATELLSFVQSSDDVTCVLADAEGAQRTVVAKYLVGCDGAHSVVRHGLELEFPGRKDGLRWVLADVELSGDVPDADVASLWSRSGILLLFHFGENVWRVVAEEPLGNPDSPRRDPTLPEIQQYLSERGAEGVQASNPTWLAEFRVSERKVEDYAVGRVFVAGDAAHVHSPAGGQGMNTGIQDACNLAWKIAWKIRGVGNNRLLDSYSDERSEVGAMVVRATSHMTRLATTESRVLQSVRNAVAKIALHFDWVQDKIRQNLAEYTVAYRSSEINGTDTRRNRGALRCGDRVPNILWTDARQQPQTLYRCLSGGRAVLLIINSNDARTFESWGQGLCGRDQSFATVELVVPDQQNAEPHIHADTGATSVSVGFVGHDQLQKLPLRTGGWMIIRPDGYLAAAGEADDMGPAMQWLSKMTIA